MAASSIEHTELVALLSAASKQCLKLHGLLLEVANAPHHLEIFGRDLQDSYLILRSLYTLASDDETPSHFIEAAKSGNLRSVINDCLLIFVDLSTILVGFQTGKMISDQDRQHDNSASQWSGISLLHDSLRGCKAVLNIAIYMAGSYSKPYAYHGETEDTIENVTEAVEKLEVSPTDSQDPEEIKTDSFPEPGVRETGHNEIREGLKPPVQEFIQNSLYLSSGLRTLVIWSRLRTSTGTGDGNDPNELYTAQVPKLHRGKRDHRTNKCTQLFVRHPNSSKSIAFQVGPEYTIASIKALVRRRTMMPNACFNLAHSKSLLRTLDKPLGKLKILHNATLTCLSVRPNSSASPFPLSDYMVIIYIRFLSKEEWTIKLEKNGTVLGVKKQISLRLDNDVSYEHIRLFFAGKVLEDRKSISEYQIGNKSTLWVFFAKAVLDKVRQYSGNYGEPAPAASEESEPGSGDKTLESNHQHSEFENQQTESEDHKLNSDDEESEAEDQKLKVEDQDMESENKEPSSNT